MENNTQIKEYRIDDNTIGEVMIMQDIPEYDIEDYDLFNEKDFKRYIDDIERLVRSSMEYKEYVKYLRKYMDMNSSAFTKNINNIETTKIKIEIHHTPFTLFDIVMTVFNKRSRLHQSLDAEMVAKEVAYLHYLLVIGLIPLSKTEHKLVHNQALFVPIDKVLGNYEKFIDLYDKDIPEDAMQRYYTYKSMTESYNHNENMKVLEIAPTYLKLPGSDPNSLGAYSDTSLQGLLDNTKDKLKQLTQKNTYQYQLDDKYDSNRQSLTKPFTIGI